VRFLVDAQLPRRLARELVESGHDAIHTLDLPEKNATWDSEIMAVADREDRIIVTKEGTSVPATCFAAFPTGCST
jgi:predicted nuclease of predicted toxin-antitoxin system